MEVAQHLATLTTNGIGRGLWADCTPPAGRPKSKPVASLSPASTTSTNELRFVGYRGKRVLCRAHVLILNITHDNDACGPYRDRQDLEGMFQATGWDPVSGFQLCPTPTRTILDSGSHTENFRGIGIAGQGGQRSCAPSVARRRQMRTCRMGHSVTLRGAAEDG
jgi:hypothetical protein